MGAAVDHPCDDACVLEQPQMSGDRRLGHAEAPARLADGGGPGAEPRHDLAAERMGERRECIVSHYANHNRRTGRHERRPPMPDHRIATQEEWQSERDALLAEEKELTRRSDELARKRRELPWVPVENDYRFETEHGTRSLAELFDGRSQLLVYHFMFGPPYTAGCTVCSSIADSLDPQVVHLEARDVTLICSSRAPLEKLLAYRERMGWSFNWVSTVGSDYHRDLGFLPT